MDSDPRMTNHLKKSSGRLWSCIPSHSGLFVHDERERGFFLPASRRDGEAVLAQPPLTVRLSLAELEDLMRVGRPYATTRYGPEVQEKASNQDFALSALIEDGRGGQWCFGAVADGVSIATFWPERAARLACLASFQYFRNILVERSGVDLGDDRTLLDFKRELVTALRTSMKTDRRHLRDHRSLVPPTFTPREYLRRWDSDELWYKTTLLVSLMGPEHGFVFWSGDGGIWLRRQRGTGSEGKRVLESADGPLQSYVWLGVQENDLSVRRIALDNQEAATLALASDGFDRTLEVAEIGYEELLPASTDGPRRPLLESRLNELYRAEDWRSNKQPEPDNASLVVLDWARGRRLGRELERPNEFDLAEVQAPPATDSPLSEAELDAPRRPTAAAPPPESDHRLAASGPPQELPLRRGVEPTPPPMPPREERYAAHRRSRTLPVLKLGTALVVVAGLVVWFGVHRLLGGGRTAEETAADSQEEASVAVAAPPASLADAAPAQSPAERSANPSNPTEETARASTQAPAPTGPLEFAVLESGSSLLAAFGPSKESAAALARELAEWSKRARAVSGSEELPAVTVVAYGDRDRLTRKGCQVNERVARDRAEFFAELLRLFMTDFAVHAAWNACEAPPGVSNPASAEARRLVLLPGHQTVHCDCNNVSWAKY